VLEPSWLEVEDVLSFLAVVDVVVELWSLLIPDGAVFVGLLLTDILSCFGDCEPADGVNLFILSATEAVFLFSAFNRALEEENITIKINYDKFKCYFYSF
jgi:hypothetical protein